MFLHYQQLKLSKLLIFGIEQMLNILHKYRLQWGLFLIVLLAFWPVMLGLYLPKWDNIDCYLPYRYFVHFSFENGQLPLWNPFQHLGYPAYSDLQNGMYNPFVWIIHMLGNYDTLSLAIELSIYWVIGAFGAFKFMRIFSTNTSSQLFGAIAFGLSGFMVGTAQIMIFIAGAAFLPHVLYHLIQFFKQNKWNDVFWLSLFIGLHVSAASPAYSIVLFNIIFTIFLWALREKYRSAKTLNWSWNKLFVAGSLSLVCILPLIVSTFEFLPYFGRADKLEYGSFLLQNPFDWHEYLSFIFPLSTLSASDWFGSTDLTMRNAYIGYLPFLFALGTLRYIREANIRWIWVILLIFLVLAAGGETPFYKLVYHLPGFGLFRHPSIFRAHVTLILTILAVIGFDRLLVNKQVRIKQFKQLNFLLLIVLLALGFVLFMNRFNGELTTWLSSLSYEKDPIFFTLRTGLLLNTIVLIVLQLLTLSGLSRKHGSISNWIIIVTCFDLVLHAFLSGPATLTYPYKQAEYRSYFERLPGEINQNDTQKTYKTLQENYDPKIAGVWRNTATLHKRLTFDGHNQTQFKAFNDVEKSGRFKWLLVNPLFTEIESYLGTENFSMKTDTERKSKLWQWDGPKNAINPDTMEVNNALIGFNAFTVQVENTSIKPDILLLTQNYHANWKASCNGKPLTIYRANEALMGIVIPAKTAGKVNLTFESPGFLPSTIVACFAYLFIFIALIYRWFNKNKAS